MLHVNTSRDKEMQQRDESDKEAERQRAETAGMLDQTEVWSPHLPVSRTSLTFYQFIQFENKAMRYVL